MIEEIIKKRSAVYPKSYNGETISKEILLELLDLANRAPSHRKTEPWRFGVFHSEESRSRLAEFLANDYKMQNAQGGFSEFKYNKILKKPMQSGVVLSVIMQRDPEERVPEWEEIAAVAMAVCNLSKVLASVGRRSLENKFITRVMACLTPSSLLPSGIVEKSFLCIFRFP